MKLSLLILGLCLPLLALPGIGWGDGIEPEVTYKYYPVKYTKGVSVGDLIVRDTPLSGSNGHRYSGTCSWRIRYDRRSFTSPTIGVCRIQDPKVYCECTITLAQLTGGENDPSFQREFAASVEKTRLHELEHCGIAVRHANNLLATFRNLKDRKCEEQQKVMQDEFTKVRTACVADQANFDNSEYGYEQYLRVEGLQRMVDAGFNVVPPAEGRSIPRLNRKPIHKNMDVLVPEGADRLAEKGIYKDENGVWRNY